MLNAGAMLATISVEFRVKYNLPQFLMCVRDIFYLNFFILESAKSERKNRNCLPNILTWGERKQQNFMLGGLLQFCNENNEVLKVTYLSIEK